MKKKILILGSTGSVGVNTLRVVEEFKGHFSVAGLAAGSKAADLARQIESFRPQGVYIKDSKAALELRRQFGASLKVMAEEDGLHHFCAGIDFDILVAATSGTTALLSVIDALKKGKRVALANKEILVAAGGLVMRELAKNPGASLIPIDSEHSAIFQCLHGSRAQDVARLILTGSGGPLREIAGEDFARVSKETVVNHPKWKMGMKISVDSATLMNKGLEIIEASWLFGLGVDQIQVLVHPEAVVHSMVEFKDGAILAQLGVADMRLPIQYALSFPSRLSAPARCLDFKELSLLHFSAPDRKKFPCLDLAYQAARQSGSAPCVLSAADEVAVGAYLEDKIRFIDIPQVIERVLGHHHHVQDPDLDMIQSIHDWAVEETKKLCLAC
ncbi:MAG: 1-deoxy-D-xylulose-5-phosphate reductoisomerase [Candidatus Omnitrophica bacterium]|nr:1-deoxy-D-xylulose-5-phosphate reductoisomerase [Candidatus Omnitrophota bacterium]